MLIATADFARNSQLSAVVQDLLTATSTPGASVALVLDGQPAFVAGVGFRDLGHTTLLDPAAPFLIYSITKTLLATAIMDLVEQELVGLEDPIQRYLNALSVAEPVTVRQLLNHTSGLPDYGALPAYHAALKADPTHPWSTADFLRLTLAQGFKFAPGQGWAYSNLGFLLLLKLLESITGVSLSTALSRQIFGPLRLQQTFVAQNLEDLQQAAPGFSAVFSPDGTLDDVRPLYHPGWVAHGVVVSTAPELATIFEALFTGQLLASGSVAMMLEPVPVPLKHPLFHQPAYGLGLMIDPQSPYGLIAGHGGGGPGYSLGALHLPQAGGHRITSIALTNSDSDDTGLKLAFMLASTLADQLD